MTSLVLLYLALSLLLCLQGVVHCKEEERWWIVKEDVAAPDGYPRRVISVFDRELINVAGVGDIPYNDKLIYDQQQTVPGPELRVRQGSRLLIHVENKLTETISIHWHGLHMYQQAWMDGTAGVTGCGIPAGGSDTYNFTVDQEPGTHWWHSHVSAQYADGLFGVLVVLPGYGQADPVRERHPYTDDQTVTLQDWLHETYHDMSARYTSRIGAFVQTIHNTTLPFLPDYPWPSEHILINGRGQTNCKTRTWAECSKVRLEGWAAYYNNSVKNTPMEVINGLPVGTLGQCAVERMPMMGECNAKARPAALHCRAGGSTRFRLINTGFSMPLRFWIDRHVFQVVARDGIPVVPNGPHHAVILSPGQRIDVVIKCDQSPEWRYYVYAMVALREYYPGAYHQTPEGFSYAALTYGGSEHYSEQGVSSKWSPSFVEDGIHVWKPIWCRRCDNTAIIEPILSPQSFAEPGFTRGCTVACNYRKRIYASWEVGEDDYLPSAIETKLPPAVPSTAVAPPAQERIILSVSGRGHWWNNLSSAESLYGLRFEWWSVNSGPTWKSNRAPLSTPGEPIMIGKAFGRSLEVMYGTSDPKAMPFVQRLHYNKTHPVTYEVVLINWEGQQHPWHIHGHSVQIVGHGWLDSVAKWRSQRFNASHFDDAAVIKELSDHTSPAPVLAEVDTFTTPPHSYTVFRITANNPGAWMFHCHMDYHLVAGMGMLWSVEDENGNYPLAPPPPGFKVCNRDATFAAASAQAIAAPGLASFQLASAPQVHESQVQQEIARLHKYLYVLVGVSVASLSIAALALFKLWSVRSSQVDHTSSFPEYKIGGAVVGSPTASYCSL